MSIIENLKIREAEQKDINAIDLLTKELGYDLNPSEVKIKLKNFKRNPNEKIFVAELENVVGWMHASIVEPLESDRFVEIRGIIVNYNFRKKGIGCKLIKTAENWGKEVGCIKIRIRTNITRNETRKYYKNLSFISKKIQEVLEKQI
ncbi:MAG: GNAT family N-acetyltransferase [Ignavibacteriales bacterium]|nr:GNAT family N-acetyltransferase [Ignavibacteriales bacterium]MCB9258106.1 GNAT family N-acetyltransferase [Ignavibacteriales bacterium]